MDEAAFLHMEELLRKDTEGEFRIEGPLGKGGMAVVYLATEVHLARKVAIKVLPPELTFGHGVERFKREAKTAAALDHPNIIPIYRVASGGKIFWYAMKYLEGRSLDELLREKGRLSLGETIDILSQVANALDYAHEHQVIHRDVKPANVMLDSRYRVIVTDFGIAKALTEGTLTASGSVVGTPYYMSPEQGMGRPVTGAADQYSVGVMAYRMLTGHVPFEGESAVEILHKHCMIPPPKMKEVMSGFPDHVYWAVHKSLEKKPASRFLHVSALVQALREPAPEMTFGEQETVVVATDEVSEAPLASAATPASPAETTPVTRDTPGSAATVPLDATPQTPQPSGVTPSGAGRSASPILTGMPRERRGKKGFVFAFLAFALIGGGGGAWWWFTQGPGAPSASRTGAGEETTLTQGPTGGDPGALTPAESALALAAADSETAGLGGELGDTGAAGDEETGTEQPTEQPAAPPPPTTGFVRITNLPPGAVVRVDNQRRTANPIELPVGRHRVVVSAEGFEAFDKTVRIRAGASTRLAFDARTIRVAPPEERAQPAQPPALSLLRVNVRPRARIFVDDALVAEHTRWQDASALPGTHTVRFEARDYITVDTVVTLVAGDTLTLRIQLQRGGS